MDFNTIIQVGLIKKMPPMTQHCTILPLLIVVPKVPKLVLFPNTRRKVANRLLHSFI